jgi:hypothetical protein
MDQSIVNRVIGETDLNTLLFQNGKNEIVAVRVHPPSNPSRCISTLRGVDRPENPPQSCRRHIRNFLFSVVVLEQKSEDKA